MKRSATTRPADTVNLHRRRAVAQDIELVSKIAEEAFLPWIPARGGTPLPMIQDYSQQIAAGNVWIYFDEFDCAFVSLNCSSDIFIDVLAVKPEYHRREIGSRILKDIMRYAASKSKDSVHLRTLAAYHSNIVFYSKLGFVAENLIEFDGVPVFEFFWYPNKS